MLALVVALLETLTSLIAGAVKSPVVKFQVDVAVIPAKNTSDAFLMAVAGRVT